MKKSTKSILTLLLLTAGVSFLSMNPAMAKNSNKETSTDNSVTQKGDTSNGGANNDNSKSVSSVLCSLNNISIGGTAATDCKGPFEGNDTGDKGTLLANLNNGLFNVGTNVEDWKLAGKSDEGGNSYGFTATNDSSTGNWNLGKSSISNPLTGLSTFVISLKTSTAYSAYLFKDIDLSKTGLTGVFNTIGVALDGSGNNGKALSHASLFIANYKTQPPRKKVPEPAAASALGLFALRALKLKNKNKKNFSES
jgi:hypothetical protein